MSRIWYPIEILLILGQCTLVSMYVDRELDTVFSQKWPKPKFLGGGTVIVVQLLLHSVPKAIANWALFEFTDSFSSTLLSIF